MSTKIKIYKERKFYFLNNTFVERIIMKVAWPKEVEKARFVPYKGSRELAKKAVTGNLAQPTVRSEEELIDQHEVRLEIPRFYKETLFVQVFLCRKRQSEMISKKKRLSKSKDKGKEKVDVSSTHEDATEHIVPIRLLLVNAHRLDFAPSRFQGDASQTLSMTVPIGEGPEDEALIATIEGLKTAVVDAMVQEVPLMDSLHQHGWEPSKDELLNAFNKGLRKNNDGGWDLRIRWSQSFHGYFKGVLFDLREGVEKDARGQPPIIHPEAHVNGKGERIDGTFQLGHLWIRPKEKTLGFIWEAVHMRLWSPVQMIESADQASPSEDVMPDTTYYFK
jgi:hypothetical protein